MFDLKQIQASKQEDIVGVLKWCEDQYDNNFAPSFSYSRSLYKELRENGNKIADSDLEYIITTYPLTLIDVSESLSHFKIMEEVIKISNKEKSAELIRMSEAPTATQAKAEAAELMLGDELLQKAYASVISRVESEISFMRELIMSCKKIWDSRKATETPAIGLVVPEDLPPYTPGGN